ncbi:hypothetical protein I3760_10G048600 [Carya illinoinensis]|nr:hypothetical protein I3760_10G048600 [Carya illinoinensis]
MTNFSLQQLHVPSLRFHPFEMQNRLSSPPVPHSSDFSLQPQARRKPPQSPSVQSFSPHPRPQALQSSSTSTRHKPPIPKQRSFQSAPPTQRSLSLTCLFFPSRLSTPSMADLCLSILPRCIRILEGM